MPCGNAVVRAPSDATWDSKGVAMYHRTAVINLCDGESDLRPRDVKMPIAVNSPSWDGTSTLGAVVRRTTPVRRGVKHRSRSDSSCRPL